MRGRVLNVEEKYYGSELVWQAPQIANEIANPRFETNLTGWAVGGAGVTQARDTTVFDEGTASIRIDVPNPGSSSDRSEYSITLNAGDTYLFRARLRGSAVGQTQRLWVADNVSANLGQHNRTADNTFWDHSVTFVATSNNPHKLRFGRAASFAATASYWLDKAQLVNLSSGRDPGYADGSVAGFGWTGTADGSTTRDLSHLVVEDTIDFEPEGGNLKIGSEVIGYTTVDETTGLITLLSNMSGTTYPAETFVFVSPVSLDRLATLDSEDDPDAVEPVIARVPHALYDKLPIGIRDSAPESVEASFVGDELVISDVTGKAPSIDATFISPGTYVVPPSDGVPPATSPTPTVKGAAGWIHVEWDAITNGDPVTYDVHISQTTGFTPGPATLSQSVIGTMVSIRAMPDGSALVYSGTTDIYFIKVIARDQDGSAAASAEAATHLNPNAGQDILAGVVTADKLAAVMVLTNLLKTADAGQRVELDPAGIRLYDSSGNVLVNVPTDPNQNPTFRGDVITGGLQVLGNALIQGADNKLDLGAALTLTSQLNDPSTAPTLAVNYDSLTLGSFTGTRYGLWYTASGGAGGATAVFYTVEQTNSTTWTLVEYKASDGTVNRTCADTWTRNSAAGDTIFGVCVLGTDIYVAEWNQALNGGLGQYNFRKFAIAAFTHTSDTVFATTGVPGTRNPTGFGTDGTDLIVAFDEYTGTPQVFRCELRKYNTSGSLLSANDTGVTNGGYCRGLCQVGSNLYLHMSDGFDVPYVKVISNSTFNAVADEQFSIPTAGVRGLTHDGTRFWALSTTGKITKFSTWTWTDATTNKFWIGYTWYDSVGVTETKVSPRASIDMNVSGYNIQKRRARISITVPAIPNGANKFRVYSDQASSAPATTALNLQAATTYVTDDAASPVYELDFNAAGAAPPTTNNFPGGTSTIKNGIGQVLVGANWERYTFLGTPFTKGVNSTAERTLVESANNLPNVVAPSSANEVGALYEFELGGLYDQATAGNLTIRVKIGTVTLESRSIGAPGSNQTGQAWAIRGHMIVKTTGATGTVNGVWFAQFAGAGTQLVARGFSTTDTTLDLTTTQRIDITAQFGASSGNNGITVTTCRIQRVA